MVALPQPIRMVVSCVPLMMGATPCWQTILIILGLPVSWSADITVSGVSAAQVAAYARSILPDWGGVGVYTKQGFTHVDVRETKADWTE